MERFKRLSARQLLLYFSGLFLYAFAVSLMIRANVGISPITSVAWIFTRITPLSIGATQMICGTVLFLVQVVWMGKDFDKLQYLQIGALFLFSVFVDVAMFCTNILLPALDSSLVGRSVLFACSLPLMAVGLGTVTITNVVMVPGDGLAKAIAYKLRWPFGKARVLSDTICVAFTATVSLIALRRLEGIQVGTLIAAATVGNLVRLYIRISGDRLACWMNGKGNRAPAEPEADVIPAVIHDE